MDSDPPLPARIPAADPAMPDPATAALEAEIDRLRAMLAPARPRDGGPVRRVLFAAGEPGGAGAALRTVSHAAVAGRAGVEARVQVVSAIGPAEIEGVDLLVLWRTAWSEHVATMVGLVRHAGGLVAFDADDLFFDPSLAHTDAIDGIRSLGFGRDECAGFFAAMRRTAAEADVCLATTEPLAAALRVVNPRCFVLPNGFEEWSLPQARAAARAAASLRADGLVRIGYALGTRTHQRDFAAAAPALARILAARPESRLVLFRDDAAPLLDLAEFPSLDRARGQVEWRHAVPHARLADEVARFDIAIAPLETGNPFTESKSEIKFVDAAVAALPLIASPTEPFRAAIRDGVTGFLAGTEAEWHGRLLALVDDPALRARIGHAAQADVLWPYGPKRRSDLLRSILDQLRGGTAGADAAALAIGRHDGRADRAIAIPSTEVVFDHATDTDASVAVAITSFNYGHYLGEALDSVARQTLAPLELVVIDDGSADRSLDLLRAWAAAARERFARIRIARTARNAGLGPARNAAFAAAHAPFVMVLDADNMLRPACCETLHRVITTADCAFAYSTIAQFGEVTTPLSASPFDAASLVRGNYIDAMAMVARWAWSAAGGYYDDPDARGWEDYDLWCRLAEIGQFGVWHPEPLSLYRAHAGAMTNRLTEQADNKRRLVETFERRHPWLRLAARAARPRGADGDTPPAS